MISNVKTAGILLTWLVYDVILRPRCHSQDWQWSVVPDQAVERAMPRSLIRSSHSSQPWYQWTRQSRLRHHDPPRTPPASPPQPILAPDLSGEHEGEERREVVEQGEQRSCEGDESDCPTTPEDNNSELLSFLLVTYHSQWATASHFKIVLHTSALCHSLTLM